MAKIEMFKNGVLTDKGLVAVKNTAFLTKVSYENNKELKDRSINPQSKDGEPIFINNPTTGTNYEIIETYSAANASSEGGIVDRILNTGTASLFNPSKGLDILVVREVGSDEYTFVYRGTELSSIKDLINDGVMAVADINPQMIEARKITEKMMAEILAKNPNASFGTAGHSAGGTLAQQIAYEFDEVQSAVTVNAYGSAKLIKNQKNYDEEKYKANENKIINVVNLPDAIVRMEEQYGNTYFLNNNKESIYLSDFSDLSFPAVAILGYAQYLDHSIDNNLGYINELNSLSQLTPLSGPVVREQMKYLNIPANYIDAYKQKQYVDFAGALKYFNEDGTVNFAQYLADTANISLYDPIALDLNNNGKIDTLSLENGVFFDHNGDKVAFKSSWVNSSDGILVRDIDGDGKITSGAELFGNFTKLKNGELAKNGAEALKDLDDNNDGIFDSNDKAFNEILVWQDFNSNGKAESGELKSLSEHGIKSINLEFLDDNTALDKDNKQILVGSFAINDSDNALASDIDFSVDTIQRKILDDTDGIIKGTGFVRNFNLSLNDEIKNAYESYKALNTKALLSSKQQQLSNVETLVNLWAKTAKQYKELDNPIQKVKINISSVRSDTTSSAINEAIKRAEAVEITLSDGVKISA